MNLAKISLQNIRHRPLGSFLSVLLLAFGTGIIVLLLSASTEIERQFTRNIRGIDMVVGAKGSPLQLILSGVYHLDDPTGNIARSEFEELGKHPLVKKSIPLAYGDNYRGYRIVGTEKSYPEHYQAGLAGGDWWNEPGDVVLGATAARLTDLGLGDTFYGSHGLGQSIEEHENFTYRVTGVLAPTGTVIDKLILTSVSSVWAVHGDHHGDGKEEDHADHEHEENEEHTHHEDAREITAGLIQFRSPMGNLSLPRHVNQNTNMQAALPAIEINRLFTLLGAGVDILRWLAILIVVISAVSVFISLYQSLRARKYELALLRSLGAGSGQLLWITLLEGLIIALLGYLGGLLLGKGALVMMDQLARESYQYQLEVGLLTSQELLLLPMVLGLGALAAFLPALQAYRLSISKVLADA